MTSWPRSARTEWSERKGILWNRFIVALIGVFLLFWGLWYKLEGNLWEYLQTTGTIYLASMSILLIACCYWKRANNWGAIAAIVVGAALPVLALSLNLFVQLPVLDGAGQAVLKDGQPVTIGWAQTLHWRPLRQYRHLCLGGGGHGGGIASQAAAASRGRRSTSMTTLIDGIKTMLTDHWFWGAITLVCLTWYSTVTIYVAIKGVGDIRSMLRRLSNPKDTP